MIFIGQNEKSEMRWVLARQFAGCDLHSKLSNEIKSFKMGSHSGFQVNLYHKTADTHEGVRFTGIDLSDPHTAAKKSFSEYLEALAFYELGGSYEQSRSGFATGSTLSEAKERSYFELIERDAFIMHLMVPFLKSQPINSIFGEAKVVKLQSMDEMVHVFLAAVQVGEYRYLGMGADMNKWEAQKKAEIEATMLKNDWTIMDVNPTSPRERMYWTHWRAGLDPEIQSRLHLILTGGGDTLVCPIPFLKDHYKVRYQRTFSKNHFTVFGINRYLIPLCFGKKWYHLKEQLMGILKERNLDPLSWVVHPFL